ncbi:unnamed protein product [Malus baccata var. baccata]
MDARIAALEANVAALCDSMESKLNGFFEQFRKEIACFGLGGASSSVVDQANLPLAPEPTSPRHGNLLRLSFDGGGSNPQLHWQHHIDFPHFTPSNNPSAWVYKVEQFFAYYSTPAHQQVPTVSFHLDGEALQWFRWMNCLQTTPCWEDFTLAFCHNVEALFKLHQTGTLRDYIAEFRRLANRTLDLGSILLKSCFIGGLKKELKYDVKLLRPANVHESIAIALQLDAKFCDMKNVYSKHSVLPKPSFTPFSPPLARSHSLPIKRLSPDVIQQKRDRGECWFCEDKWIPRHKCTKKQLLMLDLVSPEDEIVLAPSTNCPPELQHMSLSECAFYGTLAKTNVQTMKVNGLVNGQSVTILLDSGSTHNFVDSRLFKKFGWQSHPTKQFEVMISDGGTISSSGYTNDAQLSIGGYDCQIDLLSLPLGGCDVVLGVQWLSSINPVLWDFQLMTLAFFKCNTQYILFHKQRVQPLIQETSLQQLDRDILNSHLGLFLYSMEHSKLDSCDLNADQLVELHDLLGQFVEIFTLPTKLPPTRSHNHQIPILPGSKPTNIRPYHYGPLQKTKIEKSVQELLDLEFIRPSHSPFSCPVLLVKKERRVVETLYGLQGVKLYHHQ